MMFEKFLAFIIENLESENVDITITTKTDDMAVIVINADGDSIESTIEWLGETKIKDREVELICVDGLIVEAVPWVVASIYREEFS